tara:strand:+ start:1105 stop:1257 length:153 start_codon:yes stop_codon:yes gene_type:complete
MVGLFIKIKKNTQKLSETLSFLEEIQTQLQSYINIVIESLIISNRELDNV